MRNLLRCENDSINVKVTKMGCPEVFIYEDEDFTRIQAATSGNNLKALIAGYVERALNEMKYRNKRFLKIKFDFSVSEELEGRYPEQEESQLKLFDD